MNIHSGMQQAWADTGNHHGYYIQCRMGERNGWVALSGMPDKLDENSDYRIIGVGTGDIMYMSPRKPASTDHTLTATDYADGCCKAALSLLMKPSREPEDIRKALAWLTLAVGGQR